MYQSSPSILAIDPGTKYIGIAVLAGAELRYFGVKTILNPHSPSDLLNEITRFLEQFIKQYEPTYLAIEQPFISQQQSSSLLVVVAKQIKAIAGKHNLRVYQYAPTTVRKLLCQNGRATKRIVAKALSERYPYLTQYYNRTKQWEQRYYGNMFDAIAVGFICYQDVFTMNPSSNKASNTTQLN